MKNIPFLSLTVLITVIFLHCEEREKRRQLKAERVTVSDPKQIFPIKDSIVPPILYQNFPSMENLTVDESKEKFIGAVLPAILVAKHNIQEDREKILALSQKETWNGEDSAFYERTKERFGASNITGLLRRMRTHPNSIVLAQAAVESGWGQSRFFQEGNNLFGIWSYSANEPRMEASLSRGDQEVHLRKYEDISESIRDYFETIGRSRPYRRFREARAKTDNISELLPHLKHYSERGMEYIEQLQTIINQNDFTKYDHYQLDPSYFVEE